MGPHHVTALVHLLGPVHRAGRPHRASTGVAVHVLDAASAPAARSRRRVRATGPRAPRRASCRPWTTLHRAAAVRVPHPDRVSLPPYGDAPVAALTDPAPTDPEPIDPAPIIAVPGLGLSAAVPRRTLDRLPAPPGTPAAVVELPGYGLPAPPGTPVHPADLARLLLACLDDLGVGSAALVGHSASCQIVAHAAVRAPHRVTALVLVGPTTDPRAGSWPALAGRWLRTAVWERPGQVPRLARDYRRTGLGAMARGMDAARRDRIDRTLAEVRAPVLVVRGRHDRIAPRDWVETLAAAAPRGVARTLSSGGHMVPLTHPHELAALTRTFVGAALPGA